MQSLVLPALVTLTHTAAASPTYQVPLLGMLSCPALTTLTTDPPGVRLCAPAHFPALTKLRVLTPARRLPHYLSQYSQQHDDTAADAPLVRAAPCLATLTLLWTGPGSLGHMLRHVTRMTPGACAPALCRVRLQVDRASAYGQTKLVEAACRTAAGAFAACGRHVKFEVVPRV